MANEIRIDSTTDSVADVRAAAGLPPETPAEPTSPPASEPPVPVAPGTPETPPAAADPTPEPPKEPIPPDVSEAGRTLARRKETAAERIEELLRENTETRRRAEAAEAALALARRPAPPVTPPAEATPPAAQPPVSATPPADTRPAKPKEEDFEVFNDYMEALAGWKAGEAVHADRLARQQAEHEARLDYERRQIAQQVNARVEVTTQKHPDFKAVLEANGNIPTPQFVTDFLAESEQGMEILYYLATHPEEAQTLNQVSPGRALAKLGVLEDRSTGGTLFDDRRVDTPPADAPPAAATTTSAAAPPARSVPVSAAPPPAPRVGTRGIVPTKNPDEMTHEEFRAWRERNKRQPA